MDYTFFEWTPDISVGNQVIDEQHKQLLNEVNVLLSSLISDSSDNTIDEAVSFLSEYISTHLAYEEKYMEEHSYPDLIAHKEMHHDFIKHYSEFKNKLENKTASKTDLIFEIETYIGNWWINHIKIADHKYAVYIANNK